MTAPRDLLPMAMFALATLVGVGIIVVLGELLRRVILIALSAFVPTPNDNDAMVREESPPGHTDPERS